MRKNLLLIMAAGCGLVFTANKAEAQEVITVEEDATYVTTGEVNCKDHYYSTSRDNWFLQLGAGMDLPIMEKRMPQGQPSKRHFTPTYNLGVGKWMSPYLGWRFSTYYGPIHWDNYSYSKMKSINGNFDIMWDMFNSLGGVNSKRVFSIVPFIGAGVTYNWDIQSAGTNVRRGPNNTIKNSVWMVPVSAGIEFRFRLCDYANFFIEGRATAYGDNYNNAVGCRSIDLNLSAIAGVQIKFGGDSFHKVNPCGDLAYINSLNGQINALRGELATTATALAIAQAQLPCPETQTTVVNETVVGPMLSTVRFTINSAKITPEEMVNVYNVAQYLKDNPSINVNIVGYADKDTGTANYNLDLSKRRAQAVYDALTKNYGISGSRLNIQAEGSAVQPYDTNNWNRIVIFVPAN